MVHPFWFVRWVERFAGVLPDLIQAQKYQEAARQILCELWTDPKQLRVRKKMLPDPLTFKPTLNLVSEPRSPLHSRRQKRFPKWMNQLPWRSFPASPPAPCPLPLGTVPAFEPLPGNFWGSCLASDCDPFLGSGPGLPFSLRDAYWSRGGCSSLLAYFSSG